MTDQSTRSIFITGAASGIGRASARLFAAKGWRVALCDRDAAALETLRGELGALASVHPADVRDAAGLTAAIDAFCGSDGKLDALFNCAGILEMRVLAQSSLARLKDIVDVNVTGVINGIHAALPYLQKGHDAHIVSMSSMAAVYGVPEEAVYSASKFAVRGLTEALNIELEAQGIWACDVMVGYVSTPMVLAADAKARSVDLAGVNATPEQVAERVLDAVLGRSVHWHVSEADAAGAAALDAADWETKREMMKQTTGF